MLYTREVLADLLPELMAGQISTPSVVVVRLCPVPGHPQQGGEPVCDVGEGLAGVARLHSHLV